MPHVLEVLLCASERAANIARSCCSDSAGDSLLVAEKTQDEANVRFEKDYKTIADVLAQEAARSEIAACFETLGENVRGEECAEIGGVKIGMLESWEETATLLSAIVPEPTAKTMAMAAHRSIDSTICNGLPDLPEINSEELGVWIDPIDGTAEFISGVRGEAKEGQGLPCVTVLIGAYMKSTGEPVIGVINQPFYNNHQGRIIWGVSYNGINKWSCDEGFENTNDTILMSSAESTEVKEQFLNSGWKIKSIPGAGHKLLKVALGEAAAYIVSKGTTFRWDTCAPHAIIKSKGGNILNSKTHSPITYNDPKNIDTHLYCNSEGIIAYTQTDVFDKIKNIFVH